METGFGLGILVILTGSTANSAFGLGLKFTRSWKWEHIWLLFSVTAMILIPWLLGFLTVESLFAVLAAVDGRDLLLVFLFGMGWGVGSVLYGLALKMVGLALSYAIVMGLTAAIGTMAPFVLLHWDDFLTFKGMVISFGVLLVVAGVLLSAWAGKLREDSPGRIQESVENSETPEKESRRSAAVLLGLLVAALSGILSPMLNLSFAYGIRLADQAVLLGTSPSMASNVIWVVASDRRVSGECGLLCLPDRQGEKLAHFSGAAISLRGGSGHGDLVGLGRRHLRDRRLHAGRHARGHRLAHGFRHVDYCRDVLGGVGRGVDGSFEEVHGGNGGFHSGFVRFNVSDWVDEYAGVDAITKE